MAGGARALKRRIKVVKNTQQITNAMKMVAAAKLKVAQAKVEAAIPYTDKMQEILNNLLQATGELSHPLTEKKDSVKRIILVAFTSDRGLCGSFNTNMIRKAHRFVNDAEKKGWETTLAPIGQRGFKYFSKRKFDILANYTGLEPTLTFRDAKKISEGIKEAFMTGGYDAVYICYPKFRNVVSVIPTTFQFLPLAPGEPGSEEDAAHSDYIFEPEAEKLFNSLIPRYVDMQFFRLLIESMTSEFATRMTAMTAATDNAEEVVKDLSIKYNKMRQSTITAELLDIVGGAKALEG